MSGLFAFSRFTPHGFCLAWDPGLIWLMAGSDLLVASAYFSIPAALLLFLQRRTDLAFKPVFGLFAAFILACGATHVMGAVTLWLPAYRLAAALDALTALLSVATALTLWPLIPKALALPSPRALRQANQALAQEMRLRDAAVTKLQESEAHLRQAQKMEAVGQLTGGIAHDFNNLLTTIIGSLELLQQRGALDARGNRLVGNALEGSKRAAKLTSQLLSFSRRQRLAPEILRPADIIEGIHDLLSRTLGDGIVLVVTLPDETWHLLADRNQMEAALLNLVINARDATAGSGQVRIEIANRRLDADLAFDGPDRLPAGDYVTVAVCDDGAGMSEAVRARALEPFFTTKGPGAGTGLGLSQTYGFASQSGGTVRIESAPGKGSRIEMFLPRALVQPAPPADTPIPAENALLPARKGRGERILLVEDDALLRHTMTEALRHRGYEVIAAGDGAQALAILEEAQRRQQRFDLLFTDVVMPGALNGVALALEARKRRITLPVLFASGYNAANILEGWQEPLDLMAKPYTPEDAAFRIAARLDACARA